MKSRGRIQEQATMLDEMLGAALGPHKTLEQEEGKLLVAFVLTDKVNLVCLFCFSLNLLVLWFGFKASPCWLGD